MLKNILFIVLLTLTVFADQEAEANIEGEQAINPQQQLRLQQQELSMKRTACLVLSRYHSNTNKESIESVISQLPPDSQQKFINKMYATAIQYCMPKITMDEAQRFFVEDSNFSAEQLFYIYDGFDYTNIDFSSFTKNQQNLVKFIKNFDQQMQVRRQEKQAEQTEQGQDTFDMKFFGLSSQSIPSSAKYVYVAIFAALIGGSIWYLFSKLDGDKKQKSSKKRKSPAKNISSSSPAAGSSSPRTSASKSTKKQ